MILDSLIGAVVRRLNRRVLKFPDSSKQSRLPAPDPDRNYLLYLHVPYCLVLCPFCSFHRVRFKEPSAKQYFECLRREVEIVSDAGYRFDELYVGGGTPTVLPALTSSSAFFQLVTCRKSVSLDEQPASNGGRPRSMPPT